MPANNKREIMPSFACSKFPYYFVACSKFFITFSGSFKIVKNKKKHWCSFPRNFKIFKLKIWIKKNNFKVKKFSLKKKVVIFKDVLCVAVQENKDI